MFYLMMHSTHFLYGFMVLVYGERPLRLGINFQLTITALLNACRLDSTYHDLCKPVVENWLDLEVSQWVHKSHHVTNIHFL